MKKFSKLVTLAIALPLMLACTLTATSNNPAPTSLPAVVPSDTPMPAGNPTSAPAPTAAPASQGTAFTFANVSLAIPVNLPVSASGEQVAEVNDQNGAPWEIAPAHVKVTFGNYPLQGTLLSPELQVYPVDQFSQMNDNVAQTIASLKAVLANPGALPDHLPYLPPVNAQEDFHAQVQPLAFKNGTGIRYVTQYDQAPLPINNQEVFYTFQGLTADGKYYVSLTLPVSLGILPADNNPSSPVPAGGVAFDQNDFSKFPQYLSSVSQLINSSSPDSFTPSLSVMDSLAGSISVAP